MGIFQIKYQSFHAQALCFSIAIHTTIIIEEEYLTLCIYRLSNMSLVNCN
jgi:hypothetical protein